jgi:RNA polymerase sigma-70 factor (sigma-E family)
VDTLDTDAYAHQERRPPGDPHAGATGTAAAATGPRDAVAGVTALYTEHAVGLIRLAFVMLGDPAAAEDAVQEAFIGVYRHWDRLTDPASALPYTRSAVLNRCRNALRQRSRLARRENAEAQLRADSVLASAEAIALVTEEQRRVFAAIRRLPYRQREAVVLRFYLDLSQEETARAMRVSVGTVKSATSRAISALGRILREGS